MKNILLAGNSTKHIAFAKRVRMSKKINFLKVFFELGNPLEANLNHKNLDSKKIYKNKDFPENSFKKLNQNFNSNMLENNLINKKQIYERVTIIQSTKIL